MEILGFIELHPYAMIAIAVLAAFWRYIAGAGVLALAAALWLGMRRLRRR